MPIRLKSLELQGYKTFASRTLFEFGGAITAIVGPNGSGKSNIADALRWVLGEQSARLMRASKTEDMIFSGSQQRPRAGMAAATVLFDNSDGWLPIEFSEVAITRRAYRDGLNEYLLNGQHVRLRDLRELLAQAGLSQRTYTILGQGMVDASLALKPEDRRALFEEAAGVGLYRTRRAEALRRLETTRRNLDRVLDIMAELKPRLRYLERQARKAQEHAALQADLRILLRDWYGYHWHRAQRELLDTRRTLQSQEARRSQARAEHQAVQEELTRLEARLGQLRRDLNAWRAERSRTYNQNNALTRELAVLEERQRALQTRQAELDAERQRLHDDETAAAERLAAAEAEVQRLRAEREEAAARLEAARQAMAARQEARKAIRDQTARRRRELEALTRQLAEIRARLDNQAARLKALARRAEDLSTRQEAARQALRRIEARRHQAAASRAQAEEAHAAAVAALEQAQETARQLEQARQRQQEALHAVQAQIARLQAELDVLQQAEQSLSGYAEGARRLLSAAREGQLQAHPRPLSAALHVPAEVETAIAAALGEFLDAVFLDAATDLDAALHILAEDAAGRAALLPLDALPAAADWQPPADPGSLGLAADLVEAPPRLRPAVQLLLGRTLVVRDRQTALALRPSLPPQARLVTLQGEVFFAEGAVLAGQTGGGALSRTRRQRELQAALESQRQTLSRQEETLRRQQEELHAAYQTLAAGERRLKQAREALQTARRADEQARLEAESAAKEAEMLQREAQALDEETRQLQQAQTRDAETRREVEARQQDLLQILKADERKLAELPLDDLQAQVAYWEKRLAVAENAVREAARRQQDRQADLARLLRRARQLEEQQAAAHQQAEELTKRAAALRLRLDEAAAALEAIQQRIRPAEAEERAAEETRAALQKRLAETQRSLNLAEHTFNQVKLELTRRQDALDTLRQRIEEDFGLVLLNYEPEMSGSMPLPLGDLVESLPRLESLPPDLEKEMKEKRAILRRMGAINHEAREEYEKESQRYAFMESQVADLKQAEADLRQVIAELDELTRKAFMKTYDAVARSFGEIFQRLFGGGSARLILTDPDNLTETGVEIEARLPGRRRQGLALLSGGERSLTAIALVFALIKVSPTPLCVMDEVDAMLDEANVGRFRGLLEELSQETQFIVITHNRNTVQAADVIYGVTMGRDSVSQIVSLRLDEISDEMLQRG